MKKLFVAVALLAAGAFSASAQTDIFNSPDNHPYFGVRASLDITSPGDIDANLYKLDAMDAGVGFSVGAIYNVPIYYNLYFEPGVSVYRHNAKVKDDIVKLDETYDKITVGEWGFAIPMMFGYTFDFSPIKVSVFTGPEFTVGLSGKAHYTAHLNGVKMTGSDSMYGDDGSFNRANVSWKFGAGVSYDHYYLSISGAAGLTNWLNNVSDFDYGDGVSGGKVTMHRNTVSIALGYNF